MKRKINIALVGVKQTESPSKENIPIISSSNIPTPPKPPTPEALSFEEWLETHDYYDMVLGG
jgi:hypothetical protein